MNAIINDEAGLCQGLDALREGSLDFYAQMRSVFRQHRAKQLGEVTTETPKFEDYDSEKATAPIVP